MWILLAHLGCSLGSADLPTATVERGPLEVILAIPGELRAVKSVSLSAPDMNGQAKVTWIVDEGARVAEGDVLVKFDETELEEHLEEAKNAEETALTKIEQRKAQMAVRLADLENEVTASALALERANMRVTDSETVPRVERESARIDVQESTLHVERSKAALESARLEGEAEIQLLRLEANTAQRQLGQAQRALSQATIIAPSPGIAILPQIWKGGSRGKVTAGDTVWGGSMLVALPDLSVMEVEAWVHEVDAAKVKVDQVVTVVIDAHPELSHRGRVAKVADLAVKRDDEDTVKHLQVTVELAETTDLMKPGMTVRAEILVARHEGVLAVPQEAVFADDHATTVFRSALRGYRPVPVTLGDRNDTHVIVTEGLAEGDVVALIDPEHASEPVAAGKPTTPARAAPASE